MDESQARFYELFKVALGNTLLQLLQQPDVTEIMVNPDGSLHVETLKQGKQRYQTTLNTESAENIIKLVASSLNEVADKKHPEVSAELPVTGDRFQGWLPPVVSAPCFSIRKRVSQIFSLDDYESQGLLTAKHKAFLRQSIVAHKNIIVAGGTGSGKTTFVNALLQELAASKERILVLEDLAELQLQAEDAVILRTTATVTMRSLVRGVLRMRPDRIIIGEVRDGAAHDLLKAWNTGHPGGVCTLHANSAADVPYRLEDLIQEAIPIVPQALIARTVDIIVFLARDALGKRCIKEIATIESAPGQAYEVKAIAV